MWWIHYLHIALAATPYRFYLSNDGYDVNHPAMHPTLTSNQAYGLHKDGTIERRFDETPMHQFCHTMSKFKPDDKGPIKDVKGKLDKHATEAARLGKEGQQIVLSWFNLFGTKVLFFVLSPDVIFSGLFS